MFKYPYLVELLSPKRSTGDQIEAFLDRFAERYRRIIDAGCGVSIPDNPMGQPRLGALESFELRDLSVDSEKVVMNLNTFHTRSELDGLLQKAAEANLKYIAIVVEAWMSNNIDLLYKSVGKKKDEKADKYDPAENLKALHEFYPQCSVYLSMLDFKQNWKEILPKLLGRLQNRYI